MEEVVRQEPARERKIRLLRQFSKVARSSLGLVLLGTLFTYPAVLTQDLHTHGTSLYGTPLVIDDLQDLIGSLLMLASLPGAWLTGAVAMRLGRKKGMMVHGALGVLGWLVMALTPHYSGILLSRCVSGVALGGMTVTANPYVAELADPDVRGNMGMLFNLALLAGQVLSVVLGYVVRYYTAAFINALVPAALVVFLVWMPESPSYLVVTGQEEKAVEVLLELRGRHADVQQEVNRYKELNKQQQQQQQQEGSTGTWRTLAQCHVLKSLLVVSGLFLTIAFTGFLAVNSYSVQVFEAAGSSVDNGLASIILMILQFAGGVVSMFLVDGIGRRNTLFLCFSIMAVGLGLMTAYCAVLEAGSATTDPITTYYNTTFDTAAPPAVLGVGGSATPPAVVGVEGTTTPHAVVGIDGWGWAPLALLGLSQTGMFMGLLRMPFLLNQEYFPTTIRLQASSVCFTIWTLCSFIVLQSFTPMVTTMTQAGLYGTYFFFSVAGLPFTFFFIRETAGEALG